jgi:peptidoglycan-associated lipoprotein
MKRYLILILVVFAFGCQKKYVQPHIDEEAGDRGAGRVTADEVVEEKISLEEARKRDMEADISELSKSLYEIKDVHYDYNKYTIRPDAREVLNSVATWLNTHRDVNVLIEGHCDERGTNEYNLALGERRARAARDYLIARGVANMRMNIITYGEEKPMCIAPTENCWQNNRRAHFVISN